MRIVVGISGASGAIYGIRTLQALKSLGVETHLVLSQAASQTIAYETTYSPEQVCAMADKVYSVDAIGAAISSGSFKTDGMIVAPCSIKTLAGIANSFNDNLLTRAADVTLKERRRLVLMVRETPLHSGHLRQMLAVSEMGAVILPPVPAFYHKPETIDQIVAQSVGKALDLFGLDGHLFTRWDGA